MRRLQVVLISILVLSGCGPSPFDEARYTSPAPRAIPRQAATATEPPWAVSDALDVEALVASVLERNPTLASMEYARRAAASRRAQAASLDDPMLSYSVAPESFGSSTIRDGHEVELSQRLPWPGKLATRGRRADDEAYAAAHDVRSVRLGLILDTRHAFLDYYFVHRAMAINAANTRLLGEFERIAESKYSTGKAPRHDTLQARVERLHLEHEAIELGRRRSLLRETINTLVHRPIGSAVPPPPESLPAPDALADEGALRERAVSQRPELQSLAWKLEAARRGRRLADLENYPDFTVSTGYSTMWSDPEHRWMIGAGVNLPLQRERRDAAKAEAMSESQRVASELAAGVDRVAFEVADAYHRLTESGHVIRLYEDDFLPTARENIESARAGYESGEVDFLTLITAERDLRTIELSYQRAMTDYHRNRADLDRAVGTPLNGGIEP